MRVGSLRKCRKLPIIITFLIFFLIIYIWSEFKATNELDKNTNQKETNHHRFNQDEYVDKNGIKVVVGHYIGNPLQDIPNATHNMINTNYFNPLPTAGKNGNPVVIESKDFIKMRQFFKINRFNLMASDRIPLNRSLPDYRKKKCTTIYQDYHIYPKTSVIIVFHNEAWSTLFRTIWSVINRSPPQLLKEILLVDDASERDFLKKSLDDYVATLPVSIRVIRSSQRIGLIKARLKGAALAEGETLTFLDAHCEVTTGWLESLLAVIKADRKTVACPVIDIINDDTFAYVKSFELHWGAFNWNLQFRWYTLGYRELKLRKNDATQPFNTPTMAGGLFTIDRKYFYEIGAYDDGMNIWGGENLEMSFRVWQCGGQIKIVPCSHVGHLFRKSSPYSFPGGINKTLFGNLARVALVWMDEWAEFYFKFNEAARLVRNDQNVSKRLKLRQNLGCKDFEWYLDNVWPQHFFPKSDRFFGKIRNVGEDKCLIKPERRALSNQPMGIAKIEQCLGNDISLEMFVMTSDGFIMTDDSVCLDAPEKVVLGPSKVRIIACSGFSRQKWVYDEKTKEVRHLTNQKCLDKSKSINFTEGLIITDCDGSETQKWILETVDWR